MKIKILIIALITITTLLTAFNYRVIDKDVRVISETEYLRFKQAEPYLEKLQTTSGRLEILSEGLGEIETKLIEIK